MKEEVRKSVKMCIRDRFMYLWLPLIFDVLIMFALSRMNVEDANKKLKAEKGIAADEITDASDIN